LLFNIKILFRSFAKQQKMKKARMRDKVRIYLIFTDCLPEDKLYRCCRIRRALNFLNLGQTFDLNLPFGPLAERKDSMDVYSPTLTQSAYRAAQWSIPSGEPAVWMTHCSWRARQ